MATTSDVIAYDPRFPDTDDVPLESPWHRDQINFLVELIESRFLGRNDFFVGGNMFIYYDETNPRKNAGPDVFFVNGVAPDPPPPHGRTIWAVWKEQGRFPDVIFELMSPRTKNKDRKTNKALYEQVFQTPEYFMYDPETQVLEGWRLIDGRYQPIVANQADGRFWSEQLDCWVGLHEGECRPGKLGLWVRLFDRQGKLIPSSRERSDERERLAKQREKRAQERAKRERTQREETERQLAEKARQLEDERRRAQEHQRRAQEKQRLADEQRRRAEAAEAELARLKALLEQSESNERPTGDDE